MFIAKNKDHIILARDTKEDLLQALQCMVYDTIEETDKDYVLYNGEYIVQDSVTVEREKEFYTHFIKTSLGNYRLEPKGYANAQQSIDTINNMVNALGSLTSQISEMILFYETPDFTDKTQCTEKWLIAHQYKAPVMTKEEWTEFYIEFSTLYAKNQYK